MILITLSNKNHSVSSFSYLQIKAETDRTVVASHNIRKYFRISDGRSDTVRHQEIVNTPSRIILSCVIHIGPPCIRAGLFRIQLTESISKSRIKQSRKLFPLLWRKSCISDIALRILQIDLLVCNIKVTTYYNGFTRIEV